MYENRLVGRIREIERLRECMETPEAQLIIVYGRRRVGKTFLIDTFFEKNYAFTLTGAYNQPKAAQLRNFAEEMRFQTDLKPDTPKDWHEAFSMLRRYLSSLDENKKQVVFLDELPWMDTQKSDFLSSFEWFWNGWGSKQSNLVMVVCGSATSWMIKKIADNKGGLFNRQTCRLYLEPFSLHETEEFLLRRNIQWSRIEIAECYMIMGGMPYYLNLLKPQMTFRQNIDNLFFRKKGELWDEFDHLYHTLFTNGDLYIKIAELLSRKKSGLTRTEIAAQSGFSSSQTVSVILKDLEASGFVCLDHYYGHKKKDAVYRLCDYYSLFYFRYIKDHYGVDESFWSNSFDNPARRAWCGLTFEQLCKDHIRQIKNKLGISGVMTEETGWYVKGETGDPGNRRGAQIDLLIDRRDMAVNICEMKFSINEFEITKDYDIKLRNKIEAFRRATGSRKTLIVTLITTYGVKNNKYSGLVNQQIVLDDLFER